MFRWSNLFDNRIIYKGLQEMYATDDRKEQV